MENVYEPLCRALVKSAVITGCLVQEIYCFAQVEDVEHSKEYQNCSLPNQTEIHGMFFTEETPERLAEGKLMQLH